ncbi:MAG TPA: hypothetical protein VHJ38_11580 [Nitrososphaeraceae archaeon]|nr:hypothetical protein [Nitrososphaeraceae archaeon]
MIVSIFGILIVTAGLMILSENQLIPTISAQKDAFMESTLGNTTASTLGNTTESLEEEELQQSGTISRKHN